jgi:hypothetical protein
LLMAVQKLTLLEAFQHLRARRRVVPLKDNLLQLIQYERKLYGENTMRLEDFHRRA